MRSVVVVLIGATLLAVAYYWLTALTVSASVYFLTPGVWLKKSVGLRYGIPVWSVVLNTLAIALAAVPVAVFAKVVFGRRALPVALVAAVGVSGYLLLEMLWVRHSFRRIPPLTWSVVAMNSFDCIKIAVLPALFVWIGRGWPPDFRWSGP